MTRPARTVWMALAASLVAGLALGACASSTPARHLAPAATVAGVVVPGTRPKGAAAFLGVVRRVPVGDISLGYRQTGTGPDLLLIAGQNSGMNTWSLALPRRLSQRFRVTMFDNRGVGYSTDDPREPLTIERMADDTAGLLHALHIESATVVGWSTGGEIALALAVRHPQVVHALVLSGATAGGPTAVQAPPDIDALLASGKVEDELRLLNEFLFTPTGSAALSDYVNGYLEVPAGPVSTAIQRRQAAAEEAFVRSTDVYDALPHIAVPTLVTNGGRDRLVPPENAKIIARRIPQARLEIFDESAHAMMFQELDRFVALVETFLDRTP